MIMVNSYYGTEKKSCNVYFILSESSQKALLNVERKKYESLEERDMNVVE